MGKQKGILFAIWALSFAVSALAGIEPNTDLASADGRTFHPQKPPVGVTLGLRQVATGLKQPIYVTAPPASRQMCVIERIGRIRVIDHGDLREEPLLDLSAEIDWAGERGLLGLAFDPQFASNGRFYVAYTEKATLATVVARFHAHDTKQLWADAGSREEILRIAQPEGRIDHKAGWIGFRPGDARNLYIDAGDGGGHNDPDALAQNLYSRIGKILRVDVSGAGPGYAIPADNPFAESSEALPEIWAYGVRNPFRASFDRGTGDLYFGDVGQDAREEINCEPAGTKGGRNYGWPLYEGRRRNGIGAEIDRRDLTEPILDYGHQDMMFLRGCVIGGYVYRGAAIPELRGAYFFGDFTNARVYSLRYNGIEARDVTDWSPQLNAAGETLAFSGLVSFGEDADGELYVVDFAGSVFRIVRR